MVAELTGKRIAMMVGDGFEQVEMTAPRKALERAGARVEIVSPQRERVRAWKTKEWGDEFQVDRFLPDTSVEDYDALVLPGGVINADRMRVIPEARELVRAFLEEDKPIAAICHAPWLLIDADVVVGRRMTSWPTLEKDLENAGADWVDEDVVVDRGVVTSRKPDDIPAFNEAMIRLFGRDDAPERETLVP
jgi:protease I